MTANIYKEKFPSGTEVTIKKRPDLEDFRARWKHHHPLSEELMRFAGHTTHVKKVGFYHGGDVLYQLEDIPGIWHEECLQAVGGSTLKPR